MPIHVPVRSALIAALLAVVPCLRLAAAEPLASLAKASRANPSDPLAAARLGSALMHRDWLVPARAPAEAAFVETTARLGAKGGEFTSPSRRVRLRVKPDRLEIVSETDNTVSASVESTVAWENVAWHPSGAVIALGRPGAFELRDVQSLSRVPFPAGAVDGAAFAFSPDGLWLASARVGGGIDLWDWSESQLVAQGVGARSGFDSIAFSSDGRFVRAGSKAGPVTLDARPSRVLGPWMVHTSAVVRAVAWPSRERTLTVHADGQVRVWDGSAEETRFRARFASPPLAVVDAPNHAYVGVLLAPGKARLWDPATMRPIGEWLNHPGATAGLAMDAVRRHVWTAGGTSVRCWEYEKANVRLAMISTGAPIVSLAGSPNAGWVAALRLPPSGPTLSWWPASDTNGIAVHEVAVAGTNVFSFAPGSEQVLASSGPTRVQRWGLASGQPMGAALDHGAPVAFVRWTSDGHRLATVGTDGSAKLWDLTVAEPKPTVVRLEGGVTDLDLDAEGRNLLVRDAAMGWRVVDASTGRAITETWPVTGKFPAGTKPVRVEGSRFTPGGAEVLVPDSPVGARWLPLAPAEPAPAWLHELADAVDGAGEGDPAGRIDAIRSQLARPDAPRGPWTGWGRWWLSDRATRPASPSGDMTAGGLVKRGVELNVPADLMELIRLDPSAPRLRAQLMEQMWTNIFWPRPRRMEQAGWLRQRGAVDGK